MSRKPGAIQANDCPSASLFTSEGSILLKGAINDFGSMNSLWSGSDVQVDRVTNGGVSLADARLTVCVMVQPEVLSEYLKRKGELGKATGFFARSLMPYSKSKQGERFISGAAISEARLERYSQRIKFLLEENVKKFESSDNKKEIVRFSQEASDAWVATFNEVELGMRMGGNYERAREHASKLAENIARVAALINYFEIGGGEISLAAYRAALQIVLGSSQVYMKIFSFSPQVVSDAEVLYEWLTSGEHSWIFRTTPKNDILQKGPARLRRTARLGKL